MKKTKITKLFMLLLLAIGFVTTTAFVQPNIDDAAHVINSKTQKLIEAKNNRYLQTKEQPQVAVVTVKRLNKLTPAHLSEMKRTVYIVVGVKGKKKNVQIYSSKDLHSAFTAETRLNIIRAAAKDLRSTNSATFNKGLRFVFRACTTRIDHQYQYSRDKYDLSTAEQDKIDHPNRVALPIALAVVILIGVLMYFFRQIRRKNSHNN